MTSYSSNNFRVTGMQMAEKVMLVQEIYNPAIYTKDLPATVEVLSKNVPSIFANRCYNGRKFSFKKEVENTEVGHLFEHLILECLKILAFGKYGKADFKGQTFWDWKTEKERKFNIVVYSDQNYKDIFEIALKRAVVIMEEIYKHRARSPRPVRTLAQDYSSSPDQSS